jgi:hypothetical protein
MIIIFILSLLLSNAVTLRRDLSILFNRIAIIALIHCIVQDIINLSIINKGLGLHGDLLHITNITQIFHIFIYLISILILQLTSFYPTVIRTPKFFWLKDLKNFFSKFYYNKLGEHLKIIKYPLINLYVFKSNGSYFKEIDSILSLIVLIINIYTNKINCMISFSFSFLFLLLYKAGELNMWNIPEGTLYLIYLNLSILFFSTGFMVILVRFIVKWIYIYDLKINYPLSFNIIKYLLFGLLLLNIIIIIILGQKILMLFKGNIMNKFKDWKLNIDYEIRKGSKWPKKPEIFNKFSSKKNKEKRKVAETAFNLKEKIFEIQKNKSTISKSDSDFIPKSENLSLSKTRNWTNRIEIPKVTDFTLDSQIKNIEDEYKAYFNQEKKFKKIVIDINNNKENFYPKESESLFNEYIKVIKLLKSNLKDIKKELKKVSK